MARKVIKIDYGIGFWGYGKQLLKLDLEGTEEEGAIIEISSLGGDVYHALDMHNQIAKHGNVEVVFTGPSASAATFLAMGAKKVSIIDNVFFLIHKVMAVVDSWGAFNEEELDKLIQDLQTLRTHNQKFDQVIARIYQRKTGMKVEDVLAWMQKDTWMTAQEAKDLGFVDAIIQPSEKYNYLSERFVAMVKAVDLPALPSPPSEIVHPKSEILNMMNQFPKLNTALEVEELQATEEGCYLNEEQLGTIEYRISEADARIDQLNTELTASRESVTNVEIERDNAISERDALRTEMETLRTNHSTEMEELNTQVSDLNTQVATVTTERDTATGKLADLRALLSTIDPSVSGDDTEMVAAILTLLSKAPGVTPPGILKKDQHISGKNEGVDWETINKLPHNQQADLMR